jgi:hypothetical protein
VLKAAVLGALVETASLRILQRGLQTFVVSLRGIAVADEGFTPRAPMKTVCGPNFALVACEYRVQPSHSSPLCLTAIHEPAKLPLREGWAMTNPPSTVST